MAQDYTGGSFSSRDPQVPVRNITIILFRVTIACVEIIMNPFIAKKLLSTLQNAGNGERHSSWSLPTNSMGTRTSLASYQFVIPVGQAYRTNFFIAAKEKKESMYNCMRPSH